METATLRTVNPIEAILFATFRGNVKITKLLLIGNFRDKSLRECLSILKELEELSEEILIRIIEETHDHHMENYQRLRSDVSSFIQKAF